MRFSSAWEGARVDGGMQVHEDLQNIKQNKNSGNEDLGYVEFLPTVRLIMTFSLAGGSIPV